MSHNQESLPISALALDSWRVFRIISEFVDGFETMLTIGPSVSIFGSARTSPDDPDYQLAVKTGETLAKRGFAVITGGGPGMMEAANKGAQLAGGKSCGLSIELPFEQSSNPYIDPKFDLEFRYFFIRKVMFIRYAQGFIFLPGGVGTLDEMFEAATLIQCKKIRAFPIYLLNRNYWKGLIEWLKSTALSKGCISQEDIDRLQLTDDPEEVADGIEKHFREEHATHNF